ncbi:hypothetical protein KCU61_g57, partial [Aureobasidium melanogenum]
LSLECFLWNVYHELWRRSQHSGLRSLGHLAVDSQDTAGEHLRNVHIHLGGGIGVGELASAKDSHERKSDLNPSGIILPAIVGRRCRTPRRLRRTVNH